MLNLLFLTDWDGSFTPYLQIFKSIFSPFFKLWGGASMPTFVGRSVGLSVEKSSKHAFKWNFRLDLKAKVVRLIKTFLEQCK